MERGPGPDPVDYLGLPLNDEGRARALAFDYSLTFLPEHQCGYLTPFYIVLGPFGLHIWTEFDPVTAAGSSRGSSAGGSIATSPRSGWTAVRIRRRTRRAPTPALRPARGKATRW